jgi:hypothetical protein
MKFRGFYCSDELYTAMQNIAISLNESDSEYIRKAVAYYNLVNSAQNVVLDSTHKNDTIEQQNVCSICGIINGGHTGGCPRHKNNTDNQVKPRTVSEYLKDVETHKNDTASKPEEHLHNVEVKKNTLQKSKMVQSFMKGGK